MIYQVKNSLNYTLNYTLNIYKVSTKITILHSLNESTIYFSISITMLKKSFIHLPCNKQILSK